MSQSERPEGIPGSVGPRFTGRVAIVTGGGTAKVSGPSTLGAAVSRTLAREGCLVAVLDRDPAAAAHTIDAIEGDGGRAFAVPCDVSVEEECASAVATVIARTARLDILVNNVGLHIERGSSVVEVPLDQWNATIGANVTGAMLMAKHAVVHMQAGGAIVNVSSTGALRWSYAGGLSYGVSKSAVNGLTRGLAVHEGFRGIRVNSVSPGGFVSTRERGFKGPADEAAATARRRGRSPLGMEGNAWDVENGVAFLASDQARWITGQNLVLDGGAAVMTAGESRRPG